jgi:cyclopropane-fatty-acyl-phospholipid synthase
MVGARAAGQEAIDDAVKQLPEGRAAATRLVDGPAAGRLAAAISATIGSGSWTLRLWDGRVVGPDTAESRFDLVFHARRGLDLLLSAAPERAFGRAYAEGLVDVEPLQPFLELLSQATPVQLLRGAPRLLLAGIALGARPVRSRSRSVEARLRGVRHTPRRDAQAIRHHYDVPIEFYRLWLDSSLTYSCAYFRNREDDLETAQRAKLDLICRKLRLQSGEHVLDIGCGWGSFLIHAAQNYGAHGVGITLSPSQATVARQRIHELGLDGRVDVRLADYREPLGRTFDAVASIGMLEHVGRANMLRYARAIHAALRPGGRALVHGITASPGGGITRGSFVDTFIFPDGELEEAGFLSLQLDSAGLEVRDDENLREHYALTLGHWRQRLEAQWDEAERLVGLERLRVWRLYLTGAEVGFHRGTTAVHQFLAVKPDPQGDARLPLTRDDWYAPSPASPPRPNGSSGPFWLPQRRPSLAPRRAPIAEREGDQGRQRQRTHQAQHGTGSHQT